MIGNRFNRPDLADFWLGCVSFTVPEKPLSVEQITCIRRTWLAPGAAHIGHTALHTGVKRLLSNPSETARKSEHQLLRATLRREEWKCARLLFLCSPGSAWVRACSFGFFYRITFFVFRFRNKKTNRIRENRANTQHEHAETAPHTAAMRGTAHATRRGTSSAMWTGLAARAAL